MALQPLFISGWKQLSAYKRVYEYLTILFGDYMKLSNMEQILWNQHGSDWSATVPFEPQGKGTFEDERWY